MGISGRSSDGCPSDLDERGAGGRGGHAGASRPGAEREEAVLRLGWERREVTSATPPRCERPRRERREASYVQVQEYNGGSGCCRRNGGGAVGDAGRRSGLSSAIGRCHRSVQGGRDRKRVV